MTIKKDAYPMPEDSSPRRDPAVSYVKLSRLASTIATILAVLAIVAALFGAIPAFSNAAGVGDRISYANAQVEATHKIYLQKKAELDEATAFLKMKEDDLQAARSSGDDIAAIVIAGGRDNAKQRVSAVQQELDDAETASERAEAALHATEREAESAHLVAFGWLAAGLGGAAVVAFAALMFRIALAKAEVLAGILEATRRPPTAEV